MHDVHQIRLTYYGQRMLNIFHRLTTNWIPVFIDLLYTYFIFIFGGDRRAGYTRNALPEHLKFLFWYKYA